MSINTCTSEICNKLVPLMSQGLTNQELCAHLGISLRTLKYWKAKGGQWYEKEFADAYDKGQLLRFSWWAKRGRDNIGEGKDFNTALFALYMANMFKWHGTSGRREDEAMEEIRKLKQQLGVDDDDSPSDVDEGP